MATEQPATHSFYFKYFAKIAICARHPKQRICFTKNLFRFLTTKKSRTTFFQNPIVILKLKYSQTSSSSEKTIKKAKPLCCFSSCFEIVTLKQN